MALTDREARAYDLECRLHRALQAPQLVRQVLAEASDAELETLESLLRRMEEADAASRLTTTIWTRLGAARLSEDE